MTDEPGWRIRENLISKAKAIVEGREAFETHVLGGRKSTKPMTQITVDPRDLLRALRKDDE